MAESGNPQPLAATSALADVQTYDLAESELVRARHCARAGDSDEFLITSPRDV